MDSNEFYIHAVWASMGAWKDIDILENADAGLLEQQNPEWLGNMRTKPFGMHLRAQKDYIHKDRCPRHEDPRLHPELPESPYYAFFPITGPCEWRPPREPKFERLPIASYSTGFDFGKNTSLLNASGCFNIPNQADAGTDKKRPTSTGKKFGVPFRNMPMKSIPRCRSETVYSQLVGTDVRGSSIHYVLKPGKFKEGSISNSINNMPKLERASHSSIQSSVKNRSMHQNNSKPGSKEGSKMGSKQPSRTPSHNF